MKRIISLLFASQLLCLFAFSQVTTTYNTAANKLAATKDVIETLKKDIPVLLQKSDVPGVSIALIRNGELVWTGGFGLSNATTGKAVKENNVFEAASLSKVVFAYAVLRLADQGKLNLDTPLNKYLGNNYDVENDDRINLITARHVLSHTSGFPNWRVIDGTKQLLIHFKPGERYSYSGEGMVYLSKVIEKITGMRFENFMQVYALKPLGMTASSYIWRNRYDSLKVYRHDVLGMLSGRNQPDNALEDTLHDDGNAAASLVTTATDYAKFVTALFNKTGLKKQTWEQMFTPQVRVTDEYPAIAWGLGVGLEMMPGEEFFWHWGDNGDAKACVLGSLKSKNAVVYFANGANGLSFIKDILDDAIGGDHPAVAYLNYETYNSPSRLFLKSALNKGAADALKDYRAQRATGDKMINEDNMNNIGYTFLRLKRIDDAIAVFEQNTLDFPASWNVWDSLAEAYAAKGDKEKSIQYYEKSLQLNPRNNGAVEMIKKLKQ